MAEKLGVAQTVVSDYERGALRLHGELILKLAEILSVSADELLGRETNKPKARPSGKASRSLKKSPICRVVSRIKWSSSSRPSSANSKPKSKKTAFRKKLSSGKPLFLTIFNSRYLSALLL